LRIPGFPGGGPGDTPGHTGPAGKSLGNLRIPLSIPGYPVGYSGGTPGVPRAQMCNRVQATWQLPTTTSEHILDTGLLLDASSKQYTCFTRVAAVTEDCEPKVKLGSTLYRRGVLQNKCIRQHHRSRRGETVTANWARRTGYKGGRVGTGKGEEYPQALGICTSVTNDETMRGGERAEAASRSSHIHGQQIMHVKAHPQPQGCNTSPNS
jgi:hypothetical protein